MDPIAATASVFATLNAAKSLCSEVSKLAQASKDAELREKVFDLQGKLLEIQDRFLISKDAFLEKVDNLTAEIKTLEVDNENLKTELQAMKAKPNTKGNIPEDAINLLRIISEHTSIDLSTLVRCSGGMSESHVRNNISLLQGLKFVGHTIMPGVDRITARQDGRAFLLSLG